MESANTLCAKRKSMEKIEDYNALQRLEKTEGREVLVLYSKLIYCVVNGEWKVIGRVDRKGRADYIW